jgi:hypothetical protein
MKTTISKLGVASILASLILSFSNKVVAQSDVYSALYASIKVLGKEGQFECSQFGNDSLTLVRRDFLYERPYDDMKADVTVKFSSANGLKIELSNLEVFYIPSRTWGKVSAGKHEARLIEDLILRMKESSSQFTLTELFSVLTNGNNNIEIKGENIILNILYDGLEVIESCVRVISSEIDNGSVISWIEITNGSGLLIKLEEDFVHSRGLKLNEEYCLLLRVTNVCSARSAIIATVTFNEHSEGVSYTICER